VPELAAAVVILRDRVLIVRRSWTEGFLPGQWGVPCGKVDKGESSRQAVLRELHEETCLSGAVVGHVGQSDFPSVWRGRQVQNVQHNYLINPKFDPAQVDENGMPAVVTPKDDQEVKWVPMDGIEGVGLDSHNLRTIRQALAVYARNHPVSSMSNASS
jgi:8-oxo-dGTP diphosphatase